VREPTGILEVLPGQLAIWIRSLLLQSCPRATLRILHVYVTEALQISWGGVSRARHPGSNPRPDLYSCVVSGSLLCLSVPFLELCGESGGDTRFARIK
jgi:hypothetical protein